MSSSSAVEETRKLEAGSPRASRDEESLPLYAELETEHAGDSIEFPDNNASPDEVRDFLVSLFTAKRVNLDHARRIAAKWNIGTGRELKSYSAAMYLNIFGLEDGWLAYKEVNLLHAQVTKKLSTRAKLILWIVGTSCVFLVSLTLVLVLDFDDHPILASLISVLAFLTGLFALSTSFAALLCGLQSPEQMIDARLNKAVEDTLGKKSPGTS